MSENYSVEKFIGIFTEKYGDNIYRKIDVFRDKNGKKQTKCDFRESRHRKYV